MGLLGALASVTQAKAGNRPIEQAWRPDVFPSRAVLGGGQVLIRHDRQLFGCDCVTFQYVTEPRQLIGQSDKLFTVVWGVEVALGVFVQW